MTSALPDTPANTLHRRTVHLPSVDKVLQEAGALIEHHGRSRILRAVQSLLSELRTASLTHNEAKSEDAPGIAYILKQVEARLVLQDSPKLKKMFNLTGTVLHTNLGRALLPDVAVQAVVNAMTSASNLEFDLETGKRGDRDDLVEELLCELTGAEAATIVNNHATRLVMAGLADPTVATYLPEIFATTKVEPFSHFSDLTQAP